MVRFRVVKASHLAVALAALLLAVVILFLAIRYVSASSATAPAGNFISGAAAVAAPETAVTGAEASAVEVERERALAGFASLADRPSVLIYHTHTHEAYRQTADDPYEEAGGRWRTEDSRHNVVRVGEALAEALREKGIEAVHDTTDYEQDDFPTAYERSMEGVEAQLAKRSFDLLIDVHRDAYGTEPEDAVTVSVGQKRMARLMMLVGRGDGFDEKPDSVDNYETAERLTRRINEDAPGLCRDVMVKAKRYNQHLGRSLLVEVGHNLNTLSEALDAVPYLADAVAEELSD